MAPVAVSIVRLFLRSALGAQPFADPGDGLKPIIDPTIDNGARLPELGDFSSTIGNNLGGGVSIDPSIKPLCIISSAFEADQKTRERFSAIFLLFALCMLLTCMPVVMKAFGDHISKENSEKGQKFVDRFTVKMRLLVYFSQQVATGVAFATALIHLMPNAVAYLTDPCLPDLFTKTYKPFAFLVILLTMIVAFGLDFIARHYYARLAQFRLGEMIRSTALEGDKSAAMPNSAGSVKSNDTCDAESKRASSDGNGEAPSRVLSIDANGMATPTCTVFELSSQNYSPNKEGADDSNANMDGDVEAMKRGIEQHGAQFDGVTLEEDAISDTSEDIEQRTTANTDQMCESHPYGSKKTDWQLNENASSFTCRSSMISESILFPLELSTANKGTDDGHASGGQSLNGTHSGKHNSVALTVKDGENSVKQSLEGNNLEEAIVSHREGDECSIREFTYANTSGVGSSDGTTLTKFKAILDKVMVFMEFIKSRVFGIFQLRVESIAVMIMVLIIGSVLHSIILGITLSLSAIEYFNTLMAAIMVHQALEGVAVGSRLLSDVKGLWHYFCCFLYSASVPIGLAAGLSLRGRFADGTPTALIVTGVFTAIGAGILLYTSISMAVHEYMVLTGYRDLDKKVALPIGLFGLLSGITTMTLIGKL